LFLFLKEIIYQYVRHKKYSNDYSAKLNNNLSLEEINQIKTELFGKNGLISSQFKNIGSIPETDRKKFASDLNQIKDELQNLITKKLMKLSQKK
jgi:phenylalanyl-tRNA synthetase alpha chain